MRVRAGDADQESGDAGLRVAETKLHATLDAGIFTMIAVPASRRRFSFVMKHPVVGGHGDCEHPAFFTCIASAAIASLATSSGPASAIDGRRDAEGVADGARRKSATVLAAISVLESEEQKKGSSPISGVS
jgi:hypothetical protein